MKRAYRPGELTGRWCRPEAHCRYRPRGCHATEWTPGQAEAGQGL